MTKEVVCAILAALVAGVLVLPVTMPRPAIAAAPTEAALLSPRVGALS